MDAIPADHMEALYRAAVGAKKADFYAPKFVRFDEANASKLSWNWSAFFVSFYWFLYRRMYANWAIYCVLIPFLLAIATGIGEVFLGQQPGGWFYCGVTLGYSFVVLPLFANFLYYRSIKERIEALSVKVPEPAAQLLVLDNTPHTSNVIVVLIPFVGVAVLGILAAIAIPAYQAYTIRAQISEGFLLTEQLKTAIVKSRQSNGVWPSSISELRLSQPMSGRYVTSLAVDNGTVTVTYGNQSNRLIATHRLSFRPWVGDNGLVMWTCGYSLPGDREDSASPPAPNLTDIPSQYLPSACGAVRR
jgi:Tfp pilus assembly major pilin PilA